MIKQTSLNAAATSKGARRRFSPSRVEMMLAKSPSLRGLSRVVGHIRTLYAEMPSQQIGVLLFVAQNPGATAHEIQQALGLVQSSTSRSIAALSEVHRAGVAGLGLIEQRPHPDNARRNAIYLTSRGKVLVAHLVALLEGGGSPHPLPHPVQPRTPRLCGVRHRA